MYEFMYMDLENVFTQRNIFVFIQNYVFSCIKCVFFMLGYMYLAVLIFKNPSESTDQCTPIQPPPPISAKTHAIPGACVHLFMLIVWRKKIEK